MEAKRSICRSIFLHAIEVAYMRNGKSRVVCALHWPVGKTCRRDDQRVPRVNDDGPMQMMRPLIRTLSTNTKGMHVKR